MINHFFGYRNTSNIFNDFFGYFNLFSDFNHKIVYKSDFSKLEIMHFHKLSSDITLSHKIGKKSLVTVHHDPCEFDIFHRLTNWIDNYKQFKNFVCLNSLQIEFLSKHLDKKTNFFLIPHGYTFKISEKDLYKKFFNKNNKKLVIGFFSKRYERFIKGEQIFYNLVDNLDNNFFKFILYGQNRHFEKEYLTKNNFETEYYQNLSIKHLNELNSRIDVQIILSGHEGGPASLVESISKGIPIISYRVGMVADYIRHNENGYIVNDLDELIYWLNYLQKNHDKLKYLSLNALNHEKIKSWKNVIQEYDNVYNEILYS